MSDPARLVSDNAYIPSAWVKLVRRAFLVENSISFETGRLCEDVLYSLQLLVHTRKIAFVTDVFCYYRVREHQLTKNVSEKYVRDLLHAVRASAAIAEAQPEPLRETALSYTAFQYGTLLVSIHRCKTKLPRSLREEIYSMSALLQHKENRIVRIVALSRGLLGVRFTARLLYWYVRWCECRNG